MSEQDTIDEIRANAEHDEWVQQERMEDLQEDLLTAVAALPEPTLGLKGGVNRQAVLDLIRRLVQ